MAMETQPVPEDAGPIEATTPAPPWVSLCTAVGLGLATVVGAQVVAAVYEGLALRRNDVPGAASALDRLGYSFGNLGSGVLLTLVVATLVVALPRFAIAERHRQQDRLAAVTLALVVTGAVVVAVGSILAVRYQVEAFNESGRAVPHAVRLNLVNFLLGALGTAAVALFAAYGATTLHRRHPGDTPGDEADVPVTPSS